MKKAITHSHSRTANVFKTADAEILGGGNVDDVDGCFMDADRAPAANKSYSIFCFQESS